MIYFFKNEYFAKPLSDIKDNDMCNLSNEGSEYTETITLFIKKTFDFSRQSPTKTTKNILNQKREKVAHL